MCRTAIKIIFQRNIYGNSAFKYLWCSGYSFGDNMKTTL